MFYCPKCQKTYEDAVQRFCLDDGRRLVRALPAEQSAEKTNDVFKTVLNPKIETEVDKSIETETEKSDDTPRFSRAQIRWFDNSDFLPPFESEIFEVNPAVESKPESNGLSFEAVPLPESNAETNAEIEVQPEIEKEIEVQPEIETKVETAPDIESKFASDYEFAPEFDIYPEPEPETEPETEAELKFEDKSALIESAPRLIAPWEIPPSYRSTGERKPNPAIENEAATTTKTVEEKKVAASAARNKVKNRRVMLIAVGLVLILLEVWGIWFYSPDRAGETKEIAQNPAANANIANQTTIKMPPIAANNPPQLTETAPSPVSITQPPNTTYFQNDKAKLKDEALQNYLGFSLYYPNDWKANETSGGSAEKKTRGTFLDISKNAESGTPIEQMIVSYYDSSGNFQADTENFAKQVIETNRTLSKIIPSYVVVSKGEKTLNDGKQAYELKFQGTGTTPAGEKIKLWGSRLFVPAAKNGYMITMLATSLSNDIKSAADVGVKGDLPQILSTFEPK